MKLSEQMFFVAEVNHSSTSFLFKKINISTFSGFKLEHLLLVTSPATENTYSAGTDVAGTHKYFLAKLGKLLLLWLHHSKILARDFKGAIFKLLS